MRKEAKDSHLTLTDHRELKKDRQEEGRVRVIVIGPSTEREEERSETVISVIGTQTPGGVHVLSRVGFRPII